MTEILLLLLMYFLQSVFKFDFLLVYVVKLLLFLRIVTLISLNALFFCFSETNIKKYVVDFWDYRTEMHLLFAFLASIKIFTTDANDEEEGITMDILSPYPSFQHFHDLTRTHRHVRDCQPKEHGKLTHETVKPLKVSNDIELSSFLYDKTKFGHHAVVKDPARMISVREPVGGGCDANATSTVAETALKNGCHIATNAGFFNPEKNQPGYGTCFGNIVIDSKVIQKTGIQNANFGIRRDGTVVIGYLSEDEVADQSNPFVQLVTGVGWILRDGKSYLNVSQKTECKDTQTTGSLDKFFSVVSGRTLLGLDDYGFVHLVNVDGKTDKRGYVMFIVS